MDQYLLDYLLSGKAWLLVGSGPSIEMGYPTWECLASVAVQAVADERLEAGRSTLTKAMQSRDYPAVFGQAAEVLGTPRLLQLLRDKLNPTKASNIYKMLAAWPVAVYMTTNYDDELHKHLTGLGLSYLTYSNSQDHLSLLLPDLSGAIVKLHGDLTTEKGLILTAGHYTAMVESDEWQHWRSKMAAVFQDNRVIVIGHSLSDTNIRHVLEAAKSGAGVVQPVVWIAPNASDDDRSELLRRHRIRVVSYPDRDGQHRGLAKLVESMGMFVPPRPVVRSREHIERVTLRPTHHTGAAGFFVFNEVCKQTDFERRRIEIVLSAVQASLPEIGELGAFSLEEALEASGWPHEAPIDASFASEIIRRAVDDGILVSIGERFEATQDTVAKAVDQRRSFEHARDRFITSLLLRIKREFPDLDDSQASLIAEDIDASLLQYFKEAGLSLSSLLFSSEPKKTAPSALLPFITAASTRYDDLTMRHAFFKASVDVFVHPESAEIGYVGRLSHGFFAFHALGVFGDAAVHRLKLAKDTVWLLDSDTQIRLLAIGAPANTAYRECVSRLKGIGLRFFTTEPLLDETRAHLWFANRVIEGGGPNSSDVVAAARGETPYRKSNLFLEGFIEWRHAGNPSDWGSYLYQVFGVRNHQEVDLKSSLDALGTEVIALTAWPGFSDSHLPDVEEYARTIASIWDRQQDSYIASDLDLSHDAYRKAKPEAEAYSIVKRERDGDYYIISEPGTKSSAWFISHTSILNIVQSGMVITWQPQAFLSFASTLCAVPAADLAAQAFDGLLLGLAQSGLTLLSDETLALVFATVIDQARLDMEELNSAYQETLHTKYGEPLGKVLERVPAPYHPLAVTQLAAEIIQTETNRRLVAEKIAKEAEERVRRSESELEKVRKYRARLLRKQSKRRKGSGKRRRK